MIKRIVALMFVVLISGCKLGGGGGGSGGASSSYHSDSSSVSVSSLSVPETSDFSSDDLSSVHLMSLMSFDEFDPSDGGYTEPPADTVPQDTAPAPVPEPATLSLLGMGLAGLLLGRKKTA